MLKVVCALRGEDYTDYLVTVKINLMLTSMIAANIQQVLKATDGWTKRSTHQTVSSVNRWWFHSQIFHITIGVRLHQRKQSVDSHTEQ